MILRCVLYNYFDMQGSWNGASPKKLLPVGCEMLRRFSSSLKIASRHPIHLQVPHCRSDEVGDLPSAG